MAFRPSLLLLISYFLICFADMSNAQEMSKVVTTIPVKKETIQQTIRLVGKIMPLKSSYLITKAQGVVDILVPAGSKVKKGTVVAKIENTSLENTYNLAQNAEKIAHTAYERMLTLQKTQSASQKAVDETRNLWIEAQKTLANHKLAYENTLFLAPFDGILGSYKFREGAQLKEGDILAIFYQADELIIEFDIPESILPQINPNQKIYVGDHEFKLTHVQKFIDPETHMSPAYFAYKCDRCVIGSITPIEIVVDEHKDVLTIPFSALIQKGNQFNVYVAQDNKAHLKPVEPGLRAKDKIEIKKGLQEKDLIIPEGHERLYPGITIQLNQAP